MILHFAHSVCVSYHCHNDRWLLPCCIFHILTCLWSRVISVSVGTRLRAGPSRSRRWNSGKTRDCNCMPSLEISLGKNPAPFTKCTGDSFRTEQGSCSRAVYKPVWHIPFLSVQKINSWWWTAELSETCRVSCQNKFVKLVHLVGFIIKKKIINLCSLVSVW
jgi:hypothetical protein